MTVDFTQPVQSMPGGSYIVTLSNGWPYNVVQGDSSPVVDVAALWQSIQDWLAAGNVATPYEPPAPVPLDPLVAAQMQLAAIMPDVIDALIAQMQGATAPTKGQTAQLDGEQPTDPISQWQALRAQIQQQGGRS
jgi:hypothetical protein